MRRLNRRSPVTSALLQEEVVLCKFNSESGMCYRIGGGAAKQCPALVFCYRTARRGDVLTSA